MPSTTQGVKLQCEHLTLGGPFLMLLCANLQPGWSLSYSQQRDAKGSPVPISNVFYVWVVETWRFEICTAMLDQKSIVLYLAIWLGKK
jgi:hypothetical protein